MQWLILNTRSVVMQVGYVFQEGHNTTFPSKKSISAKKRKVAFEHFVTIYCLHNLCLPNISHHSVV